MKAGFQSDAGGYSEIFISHNEKEIQKVLLVVAELKKLGYCGIESDSESYISMAGCSTLTLQDMKDDYKRAKEAAKKSK